MDYKPRGTIKWKTKSQTTSASKKQRRKHDRARDSHVEESLPFKLGDGRIVSNETTVQGFETRFMEEIAVGDTIGVNHPTSMDFEERTVISILSQRSLIIDMQFSTNLISTCPFFIRSDSNVLLEQIKRDEEAQSSRGSIEERMQQKLTENMIKKQSTALRIRERKGIWGYKTTVENIDKELTAEELLDMRIKRTGRDKYC